MAGIALGRHCLKLAASGSFVARVAVHGRVRSGKREAIVVMLDLVHRYLPASHRVALLAVGSQLPAVNVGMAVLAALPDIGKHRLHVALHAGHRLVHAAQWITSLIVVELRNCADRFPRARSVAVLARSI